MSFIRLSSMMKKTTVFITHDLDEAVRIGNRIAIMHDGRVVQIGTAEDIVMHPADDYVADFVAGISRLKIVRAHAVMQSLDEYLSKNAPLPADAPRVNEDEMLSKLITMAIESHSAIPCSKRGRRCWRDHQKRHLTYRNRRSGRVMDRRSTKSA